MIIVLAVLVLAASRSGVLAMILVAVAAGTVYALAALVFPVRRCPRCKGQRVVRRSQRAGRCRTCKGSGRTRRRGASVIHHHAWSLLGPAIQERLARGHEELSEKAGYPQ